jgi:hypothetical protein
MAARPSGSGCLTFYQPSEGGSSENGIGLAPVERRIGKGKKRGVVWAPRVARESAHLTEMAQGG